MDKINFDALYNMSIVTEKENYITREENRKVFSNIDIDSFVVDFKFKSKINGNTIETSELRRYFLTANDRSSPDNIVFRNCCIKTLEIKSIVNSSIVFEDCEITTFKMKDLKSSTKYEETYKPIQINGGKIENVNIENSEIESQFYINKQYDGNEKKCIIKKIEIQNTKFEENFKLHNCEVDEISIKDTDFEKNADFFKSYFKSGFIKKENKKPTNIYFKALNFRGLALFGDTIFDKKFYLKYVTIEGYSHFRNAEFHEGLNLDYVNIQNEMNFFGAKYLDKEQSKRNTSQETYRIIKHNFEKLGNKIEANKYHALELDQKRRKLEREEPRNWKDYLVFKLHDLSSEHSSNWLLAVLWVITVGLVSSSLVQIKSEIALESIIILLLTYIFLAIFSESRYYKLIYPPIAISIITFCFLFVNNMLNIEYIMSYMSLITLTNSEFIFIGLENNMLDIQQKIILFLNKITLGYLYYQFLMSVRKDTRK